MSINRRLVLQGLAFSPLAGVAASPLCSGGKLPALTVADAKVFQVRVNRHGNWIIVRLNTNGGVTGIGDASQSGDDSETLLYLRQFADLLRGQSIFAVEWFRKVTAQTIVEQGVSAAIAASALEQCLWDIHGKAFSVPAYDLFGGRLQQQIRLYANINRSTDDRTPEGFARMAEKAVAASFTAVKLAPFDAMPTHPADDAQVERFMARGIACGAAVRQTIGSGRDLLIDVHSRMDLQHGLELVRRFEPLKLYWIEEVTPAKPLEDLARINKAATMQTAGGESRHGVKEFYSYIKAEAVDIVMPDVKVCGGMLELKKIAAMAEGAGQIISPHGPASPVGTLTSAHVMATVPNFNILEYAYGEVPWRTELLDPPEQIVDGALALSSRPGLGHVLNEKIAAKYAVS